MQETRVQSLGQEDPWGRKLQLTLVLLPRKCYGRRILVATVHGVTKGWTWLSDFTFNPWTTWLQNHKPKQSLLSKLGLNVTVQFSPVTQSCPTLCDPMNRSMPGLPVYHQLPEFTQTHVHRVSDAIQPSHPLSSPSPPAPNPSQHQNLFQWVNSSHEVAKVLEFQL